MGAREFQVLIEFLRCLNLGYSKLYDSTNEMYLYVNKDGRLESKSREEGEMMDDDGMYWTRSFGSIIENKATGKERLTYFIS